MIIGKFNYQSMKKLLLVYVSALLCTITFGQTSANLRLNPEKNRVYRFRSTSEQTILQTISGNQQTIESESAYSVSLKMVDVAPAFIVAEIRIDTISTKTNTMGKTRKSRLCSKRNPADRKYS